MNITERRADKALESYGGQGRNRTADASLFRAALYQLSYLATFKSLAGMQAEADCPEHRGR